MGLFLATCVGWRCRLLPPKRLRCASHCMVSSLNLLEKLRGCPKNSHSKMNSSVLVLGTLGKCSSPLHTHPWSVKTLGISQGCTCYKIGARLFYHRIKAQKWGQLQITRPWLHPVVYSRVCFSEHVLFLKNAYYLLVVNKLASGTTEMCQNEVLCLGDTHDTMRSICWENHALPIRCHGTPRRGWPSPSSNSRPKGRGKQPPCGFSVNTFVFEWQNFLNWEHTWEARFRNRAVGPDWFPWGCVPAQVVKGWAFGWAAWGPKQLPCTYRRPAGPSTPRGPGCVPAAPGGATRKGRHTPSS